MFEKFLTQKLLSLLGVASIVALVAALGLTTYLTGQETRVPIGAEENCISFVLNPLETSNYFSDYKSTYEFTGTVCNIQENDGDTQISAFIQSGYNTTYVASHSGGLTVQTISPGAGNCKTANFKVNMQPKWLEPATQGTTTTVKVYATSRNVGDWGCYQDLYQTVTFGTAGPINTPTPTATPTPTVTPTPTPAPCKQNGESCSAPSSFTDECCSGYCNNLSKCACEVTNEICQENRNCCEGYKCDPNKGWCCAKDGTSCSSNDWCCSGKCVNNVCVGACADIVEIQYYKNDPERPKICHWVDFDEATCGILDSAYVDCWDYGSCDPKQWTGCADMRYCRPTSSECVMRCKRLTDPPDCCTCCTNECLPLADANCQIGADGCGHPVTISPPPCPTPTAPSDFTVSQVCNPDGQTGQVRLTHRWKDNSNDEDGFRVYYTPGGAGVDIQIGEDISPNQDATYVAYIETISSSDCQQRAMYSVSSFNECGESGRGTVTAPATDCCPTCPTIAAPGNVQIQTAPPVGANAFLAFANAADINGDSVIDGADASALVSSWGKKKGEIGYNSNADLNNDGKVNAVDASILVSNWSK